MKKQLIHYLELSANAERLLRESKRTQSICPGVARKLRARAFSQVREANRLFMEAQR